MSTGGRVTLRQAVVRSLYDLAWLPISYLITIFAFLLLVATEDQLDPLISWVMNTLQLEPSFGAMLAILSLLVWIAHWFAVVCVAIPMGIIVLKREDGRHAFDVLAGVIMVRNSATT